MSLHLPRPSRTHIGAVARAMRRLRKRAEHAAQKVKRTKRPSQAFSALQLLKRPFVAANATSSSD